MDFADFVPSQNLRVFHYPDIDHFRQGLRGASVDFVPLTKAHGPIGQMVLSLPGCDIYLLHTFPRIVRATLEGSYAFVMLSMKDMPSAIFNGQEAETSSLQFARGRAEYRAVERESGIFCRAGILAGGGESRMARDRWRVSDNSDPARSRAGVCACRSCRLSRPRRKTPI